MPTYDTWLNALTGLSQGSFDTLYVKNANGDMVNVLTLLQGGSITSVTAPLNLNAGALSVDLSSYALQSWVNNALTNYRLTSQLFDGFTVSTGLVAVKSGATLSLGLSGLESRTSLILADSQGNLRNLSSSLSGSLVWNTASVALSNDLVNKIDTLTVTAPLAISGTGSSRALSSLWKPSTVSAGTGLFALASEPMEH